MRQKQNKTAVELDGDLRNHIRSLGLGSPEEYRQWCVDHGFSRKLQKNGNQRSREQSLASEVSAAERLRQRKHENSNPLSIAAEICRGNLNVGDVTQPHLVRLCRALTDQPNARREGRTDRKALQRLIAHLYQCRAKFFDESPAIADWGYRPGNFYMDALVLLASHAKAWLRPVEQWKPTTRNARRQFSSLLRHLYSRYNDLPVFFDSVWFAGRERQAVEHRRWYLRVGLGRSIRQCDLPISYTKRMAHHFRGAPRDATTSQALRWGQILASGGDERLARAIFATRLGESFANEDFWWSVLRWFIAHPMLDRAQVGPIVDYLQHQRFEPEHIYIAQGIVEPAPARQPNLSMQGRTPDSLLRQVNAWHTRLGVDNRHQICNWQPSGIAEFEFTEGTLEGRNLKRWTIRELLGGKALVAEGRKLKHCVASYASSCACGSCSIWTLEVESMTEFSKLLTLEVRNSSRCLCQARGKLNRLATEKERSILGRWAAHAGLSISKHV